jgi:hypothetical protein
VICTFDFCGRKEKGRGRMSYGSKGLSWSSPGGRPLHFIFSLQREGLCQEKRHLAGAFLTYFSAPSSSEPRRL